MASRENPPLNPHAKRSHVPSSDLILHQLRLILDSPEFEATKAQRAFLEYVVKKTVEGKSDIIKGYTLATELFGRGEDFDQNIDPVVSIHANKLRRALERYYLVAGEKDPVRIDIPKGTYVPTFIEHQVAVSGGYPDDRFSENEIEDSWPTLIVLPFENLTNAPDNDHLCI